MTKDTVDDIASCACPKCPSYNTCMKDAREGLFCTRGKSKYSPDVNKCICSSCPVFKSKSFKGAGQYCVK